MKTIQRLDILFVVMTILLAFAFSCTTADAGSIKERMKARLPDIKELKANGVIGENNRGFLVVRSTSPKGDALVSAENADRLTVYTAIAEKQGATPDFVGKRRALQIAAKADPGAWLQDATGKWYQK